MEQINTEQFNQLVREEGRPCLVMFTKDDCQICKFVKPMLERVEASRDYGDSFNFYLVDVASDHALFKEDLGLLGLPQVLYFCNGEIAGKRVGKCNMGEYSNMVERTIRRASAKATAEATGSAEGGTGAVAAKAAAEPEATSSGAAGGIFGRIKRAFAK